MKPITPPTASDNLFSGCTSLQTIYVPKGSATVYNTTPWNNYNIVEKTISTCVDGIYYSLNGYEHSAEVTSHPDLYTGSLTIPATITYEGLTYEVNSIAMDAFELCSDLTELTLSTATPPAADPTIFIECMGLTTIHIPDGSLKAYNCAPWSDYTLVDAGRERLIQLVTEVEALRNGATFKSMPEGAADFSNHGVLVSAAQLSTNKQETTEGPIANLLDNNTSSYFHSTWSTNNSTGEFHYLEVDLGLKLQRLVLKHYRRNHQNNAEPKRVRVDATNDRSEGWTEIGVTTFAAETGVDRIDLGAPYRYIRLVVLETFGGMTSNNNLFFTWTELGIWDDAWQEPAVIPTAEVTRQANELLDEARADVESLTYDVNTVQRLQQLRDYLASGEFAGAENVDISFNRKANHTGWQSLYVPFDIAYDDIADDFVVAELNNFHQYDDDSDGTFDRTELEVLLLKSGDVIAHHTPYVIRAKETGTHTISLPNATLYASVNNTLDCSSTKIRYVFHGTYQGVSGADMYANNYYALSNGSLCKANSTNADLSAFRWYLSMEDRSTLSRMPFKINIVCIDDETMTDISEVEVTPTNENAPVYDLNGRFMGRKHQLQNLPKGVYIINGKKVLR